MFETTALQVLTRHECLRLLGETQVGRVAFIDRALPAVEPVTFVVDGDSVVVRAGAGSALATAYDTIVAFEADNVADDLCMGWTVSGVGTAEVVSNDVHTGSGIALPPAMSGVATLLRIRLGLVSGRRLSAPDVASRGRRVRRLPAPVPVGSQL